MRGCAMQEKEGFQEAYAPVNAGAAEEGADVGGNAVALQGCDAGEGEHPHGHQDRDECEGHRVRE